MDQIVALHTRIDALERRLRRARAWGIGMSISAIVLLVLSARWPAGQVPEEIQARKFTVLDEEGHAIAWLGPDGVKEGAELVLSARGSVAGAKLVASANIADDDKRSGFVVLSMFANVEDSDGSGGKADTLVDASGALTFVGFEGSEVEKDLTVGMKANRSDVSMEIHDKASGDGKGRASVELVEGSPTVTGVSKDGTDVFGLP
jgi:hypothetical protein